MNLIPAEGGYEAVKTWNRQREMLSLQPDEIDILEFKTIINPDGTTRSTWNSNKANQVVKDVPIDEFCTSHYRKKLAEKETDGELSNHTMSVYEKFVIAFR